MSKDNRKDHRYLVWLEQAQHDFAAANLSMQNGFYEWTTFQCNQAVEKSIKGLIVSAGARAPKIHKMGVLLSIANQLYPKFGEVKIEYRRLDAYTFISRYPFLLPGKNRSPHEIISRYDAEEAIRIAQTVISKITAFLEGVIPSDKGSYSLGNQFSAQEVDAAISQAIDIIKKHYAKLEQITLFGSFARRKERPRETTMDLLIVADTEESFFERIKTVRELLHGIQPIIEPLVYTRAEFDELLHDERESFLEEALEEGREVYKTGVVSN